MGYGGGGSGGGGSGGSGGGSGASGGSGYRRVGDDRNANIKVDNITSRDCQQLVLVYHGDHLVLRLKMLSGLP